MHTFLYTLTATPWRRETLRYASCIFISACASIFLERGRYGDFGGIIAFLMIVAISWLTGPGPASLSSLSLMLAARWQARGIHALWSAYTSQEITNLVVFTIIMYTVGWAGKIRRKSLDEVRQREAQLREQARHKDQFLATLAHELRNPLAPLRTGVELLRLQLGTEPNVEILRDVQMMMHRQVEHMVRLVDDLLDLGRINTGKIELRREAFVLQTVVCDALAAVQPHVDGAGHRLSVTQTHSDIPIHGDRARILQVLSNLLNNAAKFTPKGGHISLTVHLDSKVAVISISDTGIGIAAESLSRVFEMFVQLGDAVSRQHAGLGIGLSLSRYIIGMHGGTIEARSEGLDKGSQFIVRLPSMVSDSSPVEPSPSPRSGIR